VVSPPSDDGSPVEENGAPVLLEDPAALVLRKRQERTARFGGYAFTTLGAITASAGTALWFTVPTPLGIALAVFGGVLVALGLVQFRLLQRDREHWPDRAILWEGGVELVLHNGEVRGVAWTDPDLALTLVARRAPLPVGREYLLVWIADGKVPSVELSATGFAALRRAAEDRRLAVTEQRRGREPNGTRWIEIRPSRVLAPVAPAVEPSDVLSS
jgi:hypothetical protein